MDELTISYSVKDVLERIEGKVDKLAEIVDTRIASNETRLAALEADKQTRSAFRDYKRWLVPTLASTAVGLLTILCYIVLAVL
jgi:hypothetical protein